MRGLGIGLGESQIAPTLVELLMQQAIPLNDSPAGIAFTRATSAWDPYNNVIVPPGVRRRRSYKIGRRQGVSLDLIEGARTNLIAAGNSEHFELANGGLVQLTVATGAIAPDGSSTACKLQEANATSESHLAAFNISWTNASVYQITVYLKAVERTWGAIGISSTVFTGGGTAWFNLATGAVGQATAGFTTSMTTATNGYWRCVLSFTATATAAAGIFVYTASANGVTTYAGTTGSGILAWGIQAEVGAFPSSYISNRNLASFSNVLSNAVWNNHTNATATQTAAPLLPNGETSWIVTCSSNSNSFYGRTHAVTASTQYTVSWLAKAGTSTIMEYQAFDLTHSSTIVVASYYSQINANGFVRVSFTFTTPAGCTSVAINPVLGQSAGIQGTIFIGDYQLEFGGSATPYWGINGTGGGRDADNLVATYVSGTGPGTLLALMIPYGWTGGDGATAFLFDEATTSGITGAYVLSTGVCHSRRKDSVGVQDSTGPAGTPSNGFLEQVASSWTTASVTCYRNGVAGTPTALTAPLVTTASLQIGGSAGATNPTYGWVAVLAWSRALSASELLALETALPVAA